MIENFHMRQILPGLMAAVPMQIRDHGGVAPGFLGRFLRPLGDPRLTRARAVFGAVRSRMGPRGVSVREYCQP